jgi:hypothetical protein
MPRLDELRRLIEQADHDKSRMAQESLARVSARK